MMFRGVCNSNLSHQSDFKALSVGGQSVSQRRDTVELQPSLKSSGIRVAKE